METLEEFCYNQFVTQSHCTFEKWIHQYNDPIFCHPNSFFLTLICESSALHSFFTANLQVYVDRFLQYSKCRTFEPENADLFFIPAYLTCWEQGWEGKLWVAIVPRWLWTRGKAIMVKDIPFWELAYPLKKGTFEGDVPGPPKVGYVWIFQFPGGYDVKRCFCFKEKNMANSIAPMHPD